MILTKKQSEALKLLAEPDARNVLLYGGSRSGKTLLFLYAMVCRALKCRGSRHAVVRNIHRDCRQKIGLVSLPELLAMCGVSAVVDKSNWRFVVPGGSEIWLAGLDDSGSRDQRILGSEFSTILFEEASEIPHSSTVMALTRLAQKNDLAKRAWYSCNPPSLEHWLHKLFVDGVDPVDRRALAHPEWYRSMRMNPSDNTEHIDPDYMARLQELPERQRLRFLDGQWGMPGEHVLWRRAWIDDNRMTHIKEDLVDIVVGVDPAVGGPCSTGIVCVGRSESGHLYLLADRTTHGSPAEWSAIVVGLAKEYHARIVAESNQGGNMVSTLILHANPAADVSLVHAGSSKAVRAEPVAAMAERGLLHHVGEFVELEDQLLTWSPGEQSPDRLDAFVHATAALIQDGATSVPQVAGGGTDFDNMEEDMWTAL